MQIVPPIGCAKCWPAMSEEAIKRRGLRCRKQCVDEGGCHSCAKVKTEREG
jgi:hypothetical protein